MIIKALICRTPLYRPAFRILDWWLERKTIRAWRVAGCPAPPPHRIKQQVLKMYARRYKLRVLIETGTYKGDMIYALRNGFEQIYSIELSQKLHEEAKPRFAKYSHIQLLCGDSTRVLPDVLEHEAIKSRPVLFWLDGHYSGGITAKAGKDTPICEELHAIFRVLSQPSVILIDDARCFGKVPDYPDLGTIKALIRQYRPLASMEVATDIIRIVVE